MHYQFEKIRARRRAEGKEPGLIDSGFTLIELLIVIVVLGILAAVVIFALSGVSGKSAASSCNADAKSVEVAAEAMHTQTGNWPLSIAASATPAPTDLVPTYLRTAPGNGNGYTVALDPAHDGTVNVTAKGNTINFDNETSTTGCNALG
jgi:general secretion pathway protein G